MGSQNRELILLKNEMFLSLVLLGKSMASVGQPGVEASERQHKEGLLLAGTALAPSSVNHSLLFYSDCCSGRQVFFLLLCITSLVHHFILVLYSICNRNFWMK